MAVVRSDPGEVLREQLEAVVGGLTPEVLADEMATMLLESVPELSRLADDDFRASLALSCEANISTVFQQLLSGAPLESISPPPDAIAFAHELVHRGVQLPALLRSYRLGHGLLERRFEETAATLGFGDEQTWRAVAYASHYFFAYVDAVCTALVADYEQERARWIRGAAAARAELIGAILERRTSDPGAATDKLRYDVSRSHVALILWQEPRDDAGQTGALETEAGLLAAALGGGPLLTVPIGERLLWAWTSGEGLSDDTGSTNHRMGNGVRAAIGTVATGLAGMATSHDEARSARRVAELRNTRPGAVVGYRTAGLAALLTSDPAEAVRFAEAELGALADDGDTPARLRATLRVYLEENLSPARAARRLGIHQNTVVYRVKRSEEMLGRPVDERRLNLEVALKLAELLDGLRAAAARQPPEPGRLGTNLG